MEKTKREQALHLLFDMDPKVREAELGTALERYDEISEQLQRLQEIPYEELTATAEASILHLRLVQAYAISQSETIPKELITYYASVAAGAVANTADQVRLEKPQCASLLDQMNDIRVREGLDEDEDWETEEDAPEDYQKLSHEFSKLVAVEIHGTIFDDALRRYGLGGLAELFENDKSTFDLHREIGMRVNRDDSTSQEVADFMDNLCRGRLGEVGFQRMQRRVAEIKKSWKR